MSLAWGGLVLLVLLLPGVLFFVGQSWPERFARATSEPNVLSQLAGILIVAVVVHGVLYTLLSHACGHWTWIPCIDLDVVLTSITVGADSQQVRTVSRALEAAPGSVLVYLTISCAAGLSLGLWTGTRIVAGKIRVPGRHQWLNQLKVAGHRPFTVAYVMTRVRQDERILMYRGFLRDFGVASDGRFSYLILTDAVRYYMLLQERAAQTSPRKDWLKIGDSDRPLDQSFAVRGDLPTQADRASNTLAIDGDEIANVVFDEYRLAGAAVTPDEVRKLIESIQADLRRTVRPPLYPTPSAPNGPSVPPAAYLAPYPPLKAP